MLAQPVGPDEDMAAHITSHLGAYPHFVIMAQLVRRVGYAMMQVGRISQHASWLRLKVSEVHHLHGAVCLPGRGCVCAPSVTTALMAGNADAVAQLFKGRHLSWTPPHQGKPNKRTRQAVGCEGF